jgi:hypothetical protein
MYDVYFCSHGHGYDPRTARIDYLLVYAIDFSLFRNVHLGRREKLVERLLDLPLEPLNSLTTILDRMRQIVARVEAP